MESFVPPTAAQGVYIIFVNANDEQIPQLITWHRKEQKVTASAVVTTQQADSMARWPAIALGDVG